MEWARQVCQLLELGQLQEARIWSRVCAQVQLLQPCQLTQCLHTLKLIMPFSTHSQGVQASQLLQWHQLCCDARHAAAQ
jgi:hypothetical protein